MESVNKGVVPNNKGIAETLDVVDFLVSTGNVVHAVKAPESAGGTDVTFTEYATFLPLALKVKPMVDGISEVSSELLFDSLTEEEKQLFVDKVMESEYLQDMNSEEVVRDVFDVIVPLKNFITKYFLTKSAVAKE